MIDKKQATQKGIKILDSTKDSNPLEEMLKTHFPQSIREGQVNLNAIAALLGKDISNMQGYELTFTGKGLANALYTTPCQKVLKHKETFCHSKTSSCHSEPALAGEESSKSVVGVEGEFEREEGATSQFKPLRPLIKENSNDKQVLTFSNLGNTNQNTLIIGDNLDALKILKSAYSEKIKMIYIDPPYNTKNDNFIYPDDFRADYQAILREVGLLEVDENENEVESETLQFFRNITGSKSHSGWLSFMLPRLKLARDLLKEDGVIFISIDDNEQANLKLLCDEIFGEENFVGDFIRKTKSTTNDAKIGLNYQHEFLLCYAKSKDNLNLLGGQKDLSKYKNPDNDPNGEWVSSDPTAKSGDIKTGFFAVKNPYTGKEDYPTNGRFWRFSQNTMQKHIDEGHICFKKEYKEGERGFIYKRYLKELKTNLKTFDSLRFVDNKFMNQSATKELLSLGLGEYFIYPKSVEFMKEIINHGTNDNSDIILDFFAGTGTTAQAVMELNSEDKGNRECILVQLDEPIKEEKSKTAYDFCKNELGSENPTISDITIERVKRAAKKINANTCFNVFTLENKPELLSDENSLKLETNADLSALDKAINLALSAGKTLNKPLESIIENKLYKCEDSYFCIECDKKVLEELSKTSDEYIYLDGFADINLEHFLNLDAQFKERLNVVY